MFGAACSAILVFALCILILQYDMSWPWVFRLPVLLLLLGGVTYYLVARDTPEELGFRSPNEGEATQAGTENHGRADEGTVERYMAAFSNWRFLIACVSLGFESMARYGLLIWVPAYYLGEGWKNQPVDGLGSAGVAGWNGRSGALFGGPVVRSRVSLESFETDCFC